MLIPPDDAAHFLRVYKELLHKIAKFEGEKAEDYLPARTALYKGKHFAHPPTDDPDLLAALKTAVYGNYAVGRHLARGTEIVSMDNKVYWIKGITTEPEDIISPWVMVITAVMQFRGHWICDGLFEGGNIHIGSNMRRDLAETISDALPAAPLRAEKRAAEKTRSKNNKPKKTAKRRAPANSAKDDEREKRIAGKILTSASTAEERALGWYDYLAGKLGFPFRAVCVQTRKTSPLKKGEEVKVVDLPPEEECEREMFVEIRWEQRKLAVPLGQLEVLDKDKATREAVEDWHYWNGSGNRF